MGNDGAQEQKLAAWAEKTSIGVAQCKFCLVTFKTGKKSLIAHSETKKHISHTPIYPAKVTQLKIKESLSGIIVKETDEIKKKKTRWWKLLVRFSKLWQTELTAK